MKSVKYVISENFNNLYRIFSIAKYEILSENRDSKIGILWGILNPLIQIMAYWFAFGVGIRGGADIDGVPFINWMLVGLIPWFFLSSTIRNGTIAIHKRAYIITKMKFPISILPTAEILKELFTHLISIIILLVFLLLNGVEFKLYMIRVIYYLFASILFSISFSMVTSVLNMMTRDVKRIINASMRLLIYVTPVLWSMDKLPDWGLIIVKLNPLFYIVNGYRNSLLYDVPIFSNLKYFFYFWSILIILFLVGCKLLYTFKQKFIDFI